MSGEDFFISQFNKDSKVIGDDGALVENHIYSMDAFFENIHFKRDWFTLKEIAIKSMLVNISDAIAMNAKPLYALLTVAIPKSLKRSELIELANGFKEVANEYGIKIIGGDTIANTKLDISVTIISKSKNPKFRKGIKQNQLVAFTGTIGSVKKDLQKAFRTNKIKKNSKFIKPKLKANFFYEASKYISSAMDISDGLYFELNRLSKLNRVDFIFNKKFQKKIACSGEEYEMLFSFDKKYRSKILSIAKKHRVNIDIFATTKRGKFTKKCKAHHF